ncbi:MAG: Ig-like domain-containing protein [Bacillota bacterium]|jgi:hypothetical protein
MKINLNIKELSKIMILMIIFACIFVPVVALAGNGDGSGGGSNEPLRMESSYPADGAKNVALDVTIKCTFSKNVAYIAVKDKNATLFTLKEKDGIAVPFKVVIADAEIEVEKKNDINLVPTKPLKEGTTYVVTALAGIQSKSGAIMASNQSFSFTTKAAAPAATTTNKSTPTATTTQSSTATAKNNDKTTTTVKETSTVSSATDNTATQQADPVTAPVATVNEQAPTQEVSITTDAANTDQANSSVVWIIIIIVAAAAVALGMYMAKRRSNIK